MVAGMTLPPLPPMEMRVGGQDRKDDRLYMESAIDLANQLGRHCGVSSGSRLIDVGCGQARLLYGLLSVFGSVERYVGVDVSAKSIEWAKSSLEPAVPFAEFFVSDYPNERYNPSGKGELVLPDGPFDCAVLWSVFTHMRLADVRKHLAAIAEVVPSGGFALATAFVEDRAKDEEENPAHLARKWRGRLHGVVFGRSAFEAAVAEAGWLVVERLPQGVAWSFAYILRRAAS